MSHAIQFVRENAIAIVLVLYFAMTLFAWTVRRLPLEQQARLPMRLVSAAYFCGSLAGQLLTLAESFIPLLSGKPMPRFKRLIEDATPTEKTLPPAEDSEP